MKDQLKGYRLNSTLAAAAYLLLGLALIIWPNTSLRVLCMVLGAALTVYGVFHLVSYFRQQFSTFRLELVFGVLSTAFGLFTLFQPYRVSEILFLVLGLVIVIDSVLSIQRALRLHTYYFEYWWIPLAISIATGVLGIVLIFRPYFASSVLLRMAGVILVIQAVHDLWGLYQLSALVKKIEGLEDKM